MYLKLYSLTFLILFHFGQISFQQQKKSRIIDGHIVTIIPINSSPPTGFRVMYLEEGLKYKQELTNLLDSWDIVAFDHGKLDGLSYGNKIMYIYGPECGNKFIISTLRIDQ